MTDYIKNFKKRSSHQISYLTKKMYLYNEVSLSVKWIMILLLSPLILLVLTIGLVVFLKFDSAILAPSIALIILGTFFAVMGTCIWDYSKKITVHLFFDKSKKELSIQADECQVKRICNPKLIRVVVRYYRLYSHGSSIKGRRVILISVEVLGNPEADSDQIYLRIASMQCRTRKEAIDELEHVKNIYQCIAEWLEIPILQENKKMFIEDSEKTELWYLYMS
ncbi:MAG: hypothetical protein EOO69_05670 [Moraxellaceae bacterium]|nr:MAG: hypothetical protein EOO69_05670 [Moraxellaceae bacterium]